MVRHFNTSILLLAISTLLIASACSGPEGVHTPTEDAGIDDVDDGDTEVGEPDATDVVDEDVPPPGPPRIEVSPSTISFQNVAIEDSETTTITARNLGESTLNIIDIQITQAGRTGQIDFAPGNNWPDFPQEMSPNTFRDFDLVYTPTEAGAHRGEVLILSDDPDNPQVSLRIETISAYPDIDGPRRINFGTVEVGEEKTERIAVYNRGMPPLEVESIVVDSGAQIFSAEVVNNSFPFFVSRNYFFYVDVTFAPESNDTVLGNLLIINNDPKHPDFSIVLSGNSPEPCLNTSGDLDFGTLHDGTSSTQNITLLNCSTSQTLTITDVELEDDGGGIFELVNPVDDPLIIGVTQTAQIGVRATMSGDQEVVGLLTLSSDDPGADQVEHQLRVRPVSSGD